MMAENIHERVGSFIPTDESVDAVSDFFDQCIEEFDIPMKIGFKLKVVADEIYSNIVHYSGATSSQIRFQNSDQSVSLCFSDNGVPYNPLEAADPDVTAAAADRQIGGLGLFMVKNMAQEIRYEFADGQNHTIVVMSKAVQKKKALPEDF